MTRTPWAESLKVLLSGRPIMSPTATPSWEACWAVLVTGAEVPMLMTLETPRPVAVPAATRRKATKMVTRGLEDDGEGVGDIG